MSVDSWMSGAGALGRGRHAQVSWRGAGARVRGGGAAQRSAATAAAAPSRAPRPLLSPLHWLQKRNQTRLATGSLKILGAVDRALVFDRAATAFPLSPSRWRPRRRAERWRARTAGPRAACWWGTGSRSAAATSRRLARRRPQRRRPQRRRPRAAHRTAAPAACAQRRRQRPPPPPARARGAWRTRLQRCAPTRSRSPTPPRRPATSPHSTP
jgi:hypothetical protein